MGKIRIYGKDLLRITVGAALMAFSINRVFAPADMVTGGVSGLAIVLSEAAWRSMEIRIPIWIPTAALNIPLFLLAFGKMPKPKLLRNLMGTAALTVFLAVIPERGLGIDDPMLSAVFGGAVSGVGTGLIFSANSSTGGTDLAAVLLKKHFRSVKVTTILLILDGSVILSGVWMFGVQTTLYTVIAVCIVDLVSDRVLQGVNDALAIYIISRKDGSRIAEEIMQRTERGVTYIRVMGGYSGEERRMVFCVVAKRQFPVVRDIVEEIDREAFVVVSAANEVLGEGFRNISADI